MRLRMCGVEEKIHSPDLNRGARYMEISRKTCRGAFIHHVVVFRKGKCLVTNVQMYMSDDLVHLLK